MASWGSSSARLRRLGERVVDLTERLAVAEEAVEASQRDTHFRLDALEGAA